jgi:hypothetical protein
LKSSSYAPRRGCGHSFFGHSLVTQRLKLGARRPKSDDSHKREVDPGWGSATSACLGVTRLWVHPLTEAHEVVLSLLDLCALVPVGANTIREAIRLGGSLSTFTLGFADRRRSAVCARCRIDVGLLGGIPNFGLRVIRSQRRQTSDGKVDKIPRTGTVIEMTRKKLSALKASGRLQLRKQQLAMFSQIDSDAILEFASTVATATTDKTKALLKSQRQQANRIGSHELAMEILRSYFEDQFSLAQEVGHLADKLAIVALYGQVELSYKAMIVVAIPGVDGRQLFRWAMVRKTLKEKDINVQRVASYAEVNQLRCLNNAIKHGSRVGAELARTGWGRASETIDADKCSRSLHEFAGHGESFLRDLGVKLLHLITSEKPRGP